MNTDLMFSSKTDDWATPQSFFEACNQLHGFTLDVCATAENAKCKNYFTENDNGLIQNWGVNVCWMNPPYGDAEHICKPNCKKKICETRGGGSLHNL